VSLPKAFDRLRPAVLKPEKFTNVVISAACGTEGAQPSVS
jgi:hypothetical protein